ncbi:MULTISPECIES: hypothetical protein [Enterococcus]|uniref:Uncharacterized protein n=1 Tax=Enterococcus alishanensis TaxID=1303817 RepID=A0ABS6TCJ0_9ENTE|nr:hypothetical protein [Enterococcus alishanensis]MBV7390633.1 hypothetical protein [Enterococcus alishanensis]
MVAYHLIFRSIYIFIFLHLAYLIALISFIYASIKAFAVEKNSKNGSFYLLIVVVLLLLAGLIAFNVFT